MACHALIWQTKKAITVFDFRYRFKILRKQQKKKPRKTVEVKEELVKSLFDGKDGFENKELNATAEKVIK